MTTVADRLTVVIADDNKDHAASLSCLINLWGHDAHTYLDAASALEFCERHPVNILMLDIGLPLRIDGLVAARRARQITQSMGMTIVAVTGFDDHETRSMAKEAGFDHYFVKPIDLDGLQSLLQGLHTDMPVCP